MVTATFAPSVHDTTPNAKYPTTTLNQVAYLLKLSQYWVNEQSIMANRVARFRRYYDGDHDIKLSDEVMKLLGIKDADDGMPINLMPSIVETKADREIVQAMEGIEDSADSTEEGSDSGASQTIDIQATAIDGKPKTPTVNAITQWAQEVMDNNDFDVIQGDVHIATGIDADSYVLVEWDPIDKQSKFHHELAWDGVTGMLMVYKSHNVNKPYCAIKIWQIDGEELSITTRMNVYYEDRCEKFIAQDLGQFTPYLGDDGKGGTSGVFKYEQYDAMPLGIPVFHFRNGGRGNYGISDLRNVIPMQNALNRFHYDAIVAGQLTGFPIYLQFGFSRDDDTVSPGMIIKVEGEITKDQVVDFRKLEGSDPTPIIASLNNEKQLIFEVSRTPDPGLSSGSGSNKSGEYLKQLEVGLIGKVKKFTTRAGSSWEQVFAMAWKLQQVYGNLKPPTYKRFVCKWKPAGVRNDTEVVANVIAMDPIWGHEQSLREASAVYDDLTEERIQDIIAKQAAKEIAAAQAMQAQPAAPGQPASTDPNQPTDNQQPGDTPAVKGKPLPRGEGTKPIPVTPEDAARWNQMFEHMKAAKNVA